jgi:hypothetical protein
MREWCNRLAVNEPLSLRERWHPEFSCTSRRLPWQLKHFRNAMRYGRNVHYFWARNPQIKCQRHRDIIYHIKKGIFVHNLIVEGRGGWPLIELISRKWKRRATTLHATRLGDIISHTLSHDKDLKLTPGPPSVFVYSNQPAIRYLE